ncbi:transposase [Endothiovibrio diazotrophicus]
MPKPRKSLISLESTPYYHCVSRCVRRAFLIGEQYEHRRRWVEDRLAELERVFAIDVCAFSIMHNHTHTALHVDVEQAKGWSVDEVVERWLRLFKGPLIAQRFLNGEPLGGAERDQLDRLAEQWRGNLMSISWFMRCLNEHIARKANAEDHCTGRFWEGRFRSQALLDEKALLACMAYVDLNPIRADITKTPETSDYASIQQRIARALGREEMVKGSGAVKLLPLVGDLRESMPKGIPFHLTEYLELVEWTGRAMVPGKRGSIPESLPPILERLQFDGKGWLQAAQHFERRFKGWVGVADAVKATCKELGFRRTPGLAACHAYLS